GASSTTLPLTAQLCPIIEPLAYLPFKPAVRWIVISLPSHLFREIVLPGKGVRLVVVIAVARAVAFFLHQLGRGVEYVLRRKEGAVLPCRPPCSLVGRIDGIGFRSGGEIDAGLGQGEFAFRGPQIGRASCRERGGGSGG